MAANAQNLPPFGPTGNVPTANTGGAAPPPAAPVLSEVKHELEGIVDFSADMADTIAELEATNGIYDYSDSRAQLGYIEPDEYFMVPPFLEYAMPGHARYDEDRLLNGNDFLAVALANFAALSRLGAAYSVTDRLWIAITRAELFSKKILAATPEARRTPSDEVTFLSDRWAPTADEVKNFREAVAANPAVMKRARDLAGIHAAMMLHMFVTRGHHFQNGYENAYDRMYRAAQIADDKTPTPYKAVMRTALHPFGLFQIMELVEQLLKDDHLPRAIAMRMDAMPAGTALIATCLAAVRQLSVTPAWAPFSQLHGVHIEALEAEVKRIREDRYAYHMNSGLFGRTKKQANEAPARAIAAFVEGYVQSLNNEAPICAEKALKKVAMENPVMVKVTARAFTNYFRMASRSGNFREVLALESPRRVAARQAQGPNVDEPLE